MHQKTRMRRSPVFVLLLASACAAPPSPSHQTPALPLWRQDLSNLSADRALVRACLDRQAQTGEPERCLAVIQRECEAGEPNPAWQRHCDWRAIAAWEDEMASDLSALKAKLDLKEAAKLETGQRAWTSSMLADVGFAMDRFAGGSLAGPIGAQLRAQETAERVIFLEQLRALIEEN